MKTHDLEKSDALCVRTFARIARALDMNVDTLRRRIAAGGPLSKIVRKDEEDQWFALTEELRAYLRGRRPKAS